MAEAILEESSAVVEPDSDDMNKETFTVLENRWGKSVWDLGWTGVPSILLKSQRRLGLSNNQVVVLLHLLDHWHGEKARIFPKLEQIADRMDLSISRTRTLIKGLEDGGFLTRKPRMRPGGQTSNKYHLDGLIKKLKKIAPDFHAHKNAEYDLEKPRNPKSPRKRKGNNTLIE